MSNLEPAEMISGTIDRISNSGNGMLDYEDGEISIGPVKPESVGRTVNAVVYSQSFALCLTEFARTEYYDNTFKAITNQLSEKPPKDCPSPGTTIEVTLEGVNSSGHGNAEYRGIPVRVRHAFATDRDVTTGQPVPVKVVRIEPDQIVASAVLDVNVRDTFPEVGEEASAIIAHRSHSGKGLVESFAEGIINIGPVSEEAIGKQIDMVMLENGFAYCLTSSLTANNYQNKMNTHVTDKAVQSSDTLSEVLTESVTVQRERVGSSPSGYQRDPTFSRKVKEVYEYSCAVCGAKRTAPNGASEVEAAHIYPVAGADDDRGHGGPDTVDNGVALCRLHHWAFDNGWFAFDDDYRVIVCEKPELSGYEEISRYDGEKIRLPEIEDQWPDTEFIQAHRTRIWKQEE